MINLRKISCILALALALVLLAALVPSGAGATAFALKAASPPSTALASVSYARGDPLPRIVCPEGFEARIYASGLRSPDGLAFDPNDILYVTEEVRGRVSRIAPDGSVTPVLGGLDSPEGIAFDRAGNLYVVEDVQNGRLLRVGPDGGQTTLAAELDAPEGVVWSPDDYLYVTESNIQFAANPPWDFVTGVSRASQSATVTPVFTTTILWSYSAITMDAQGLLYVANEASGIGTTDSVFRVDPATQTYSLFASGLIAPEGIHFSPGGQFPLYVAEEDVGDGQGRLSLVQADGSHLPLCTGFSTLEDVAVDSHGNLYVTEDREGLIVQILVPDFSPPGPPRNLSAEPPGWTATQPFSLTWENPLDVSGIAGAYLRLDIAPSFASDGAFYAGTDLSAVEGITVANPGAHLAYVWLEDGAGNADHTLAATTALYYDPDPPESPLGLIADPYDWTATNAFALSWANPADVSGVTTACYRLDTPPRDTAEYDGCRSEANISSLDEVTVPADGQHLAYLWLADSAGNSDVATAVSATLRYDGQAPESTAYSPAQADVAPIRVAWTAADAHSGIDTVTLWVKTDTEGTWASTGLAAQSRESGFFLIQPAGEGRYFFATVAVDRAGNAEAEPMGDGDASTLCRTWQRVYLPLLFKGTP